MNLFESVILCEGYHDRAFWAGLLLHLGCNVARPPYRDPWEEEVAGANRAYSSPAGFIKVTKCNGKQGVRAAAKARLQDRDKTLRWMILNCDSDQRADGTAAKVTLSHQSVLDLLKESDPEVTHDGDHFVLKDGTRVSVIRWHDKLGPLPGLPNQLTLERLVCAACSRVHAERGEYVQKWLDGRPDGPEPSEKSYAWSYLAGWFPEHSGYESFLERIWSDELMRREIQILLEENGTWATVSKFVNLI